MPHSGVFRKIAVELALPVIAGTACSLTVLMFAGGFANGATWSGLNPNGGGPGFALLLISGIGSLAAARFGVLRFAPASLLVFALTAAFCGGIFWLLLSQFAAIPPDVRPPLVSGVVGSYLVPRVVASVLHDTWSRAESVSLPDVSRQS